MKWTLLYEEDTSAEKKKNPKIGKKSSSVKRNGTFNSVVAIGQLENAVIQNIYPLS